MKSLHLTLSSKTHKWLLLPFIFLTIFSFSAWGADNTYTFTSKDWAATEGNWTNGKSGNTYNSGVQVTTGSTGANATSPTSLSNISKIVVYYHTNKNAGVGTIKVQVGSGTEQTFSVTKPATDQGLTSKNTTFNFSPVETGKVKLTVNCSTNSVYIEKVVITTGGGGSTYTVNYDANGGTGTMTSQTGSASYTVKNNSFTAPTGGTFTGWNTAADGSGTAYSAGATIATDATLYAQWKYTVRFYTTSSSTYTTVSEASAHAGVTPPSMEATCGDWTFAGWSTTERTSDVTTATELVTLTAGKYYPAAGATTLYPIYTMYSGGGGSTDDVLNQTFTGVTGTSYTEFSEKTGTSNAVYAGQCAGGYSSIQLRAISPSGIITTTSGGKVSKVSVTWESNTASGRTLQIYGKSTAYSSSSDLYNTTTQGTLIGTIIYGTSTELSISGDYTHIGLRSSDGAMYLSSITIKWGSGTPHYYSYPPCVTCNTPTLDFASASLTQYVGDAPFTAAFSGTNPGGGAITYTSSNTTCAEVNSSTGQVTIKRSTADGSPVTITAYLAATDGNPCYKAKTMTYTLNIKNKIEWYSNETKITSGSQTTETFYNGSIATLPATPSVPSACSGKAFVGWTTIADWDSDEAPDPLYTSVSEFPKIRENKTFYAVFASTTTGDPESTLTQTLEYDDWTYSGTTTDKTTYRLFGNGAYVESASTVNWANVSQVVVYGGTFGGDSYNGISIRKADGSTVWKNATVSGNSATKANTISGGASLTGTSKLRVYSTSGDGENTGVRISKVEIYEMVATTVGTDYVTKCCTQWDDPTLTYNKTSLAVGDADATKSLSGTQHGTLTFSSSNTSVATVNPSTGAVQAVSPGNVTITAHWTKDGAYCAKEMTFNFSITGNCTITFDANGGTGSMAAQTGIPYNTATELNTMSGLTAPAGQTFVGWNTQADGKGTSYADGANIKLTSNITLYAQWGTAYTITLHRGGSTEAITVLSTEFPYTLPTNEADYCDAWQFDGWSASSVANNSDSYTKVTEVSEPANVHLYAVYKGSPTNIDAYVRISKLDELTSGSKYIFVGLEAGTKYLMPNTFNTTYKNFNGVQVNEDGKDYYLKTTIEGSYAGSVYIISGTANNWTIKNNQSSSNYLNTYYETWYTTTTTNNKYSITPNGLFWTVNNTQGTSCNASKSFIEFYKTGSNYLFARATTQYGSAKLQIYKLANTQSYKYTSSPAGGDCSVECSNSGAEFTYPSMEKSTASADFTNTVVYSLQRNTSTPTYTSSDETVATVTSSGVVSIVGKGKTTITMTQGRDNTDPSHPVCGVTLSYELVVTDPSLEVVEVTADDKIIVEHDFDGITDASLGESTMEIKGTIADDIFISKYYEAASHMKLFALYNGTEHTIDLSQLRVRSGSSSWGDHGVITLKNHPKIKIDYPDFQMPPFTEIIFWSNNEDGSDNNEQLLSCIDMKIGGKTYEYEDMKEDKVPNWYHIETGMGTGITRFDFNGDDGLVLERSTDNFSTWTVIDLFGAGTKSAPASPTGSGNGVIHSVASGSNTELNDSPGGFYWDATSAAGKVLSTNRFYLTRLSTVKSGLNAVEQNETSFATLGTEWTGAGIGGTSKMEDFCGSGELFSEVAQYDYAGYYTNYEDYAQSWTATDNGDGTMTIQFESGKLAELACSKIKISVTDATDDTKKAEVEYRVPIIVKNTTDVTKSALFNVHDKDECKVCDVAIVDGGVLTKSKPTTPADVAADREQVYNVDVYGGGELYIPSGTTYTVNTLTVRSTGDAVGIVDVQGTLNRNNTTLIHSKRFNNTGDNYRWYFFSLPYDCNVSEVTFSNGDPAIHGVDFEIDWYDGEQRAATQANGNWKSIASHPDYPNVIKAGYGYTIAVEEKAGHDNVSLIFPMANFTEPTQVNVPVGNWGAGNDDVTVNHKGWNVVGNPFLTKYKAQEDLDINGELREGILVAGGNGWTQEADGVNYATIPFNGGKSGYDQQALTDHSFVPFQSFIIQVGGDAERSDLAVQLKNSRKDKRTASPIRRSEEEYEVESLTPVWVRLNLTNATGEEDKTTILISDKYTADYDMQFDLSKWYGSSYGKYTKPVLSSVYGGQDLAFNALPDSIVADRVPLKYYSRNAGTMAFELSGAYNWRALDEVILYDATTGTQHNLLTSGKYEFQTAAGMIENRFSISAKVNRHEIPEIATSTDLIDMPNVRLTVQDHNLLINGIEPGTSIYVFDMLGRLVGRKVCNDSFVTFTIPTTGVYNVRLESKQAGVTLRTIVK